MCGLVAILNREGRRPAAALLEAMGERIAHRGPDDEGTHVEGAVGLHHRRLAIIDLVSGHQPMTVQGVTTVFNGEIYNYVELRDTLRQHGHRFETTSDTEVLLHAYLEYGIDFVKHLNGMFAFVLLDSRRQRLIAARDHFGVKPLYFYRDERVLLYASEIKALLAHPRVRAEVCAEGLRDYATFQYTLGATTLFKGISKLAPAHLHVVDLRSGELTSQRFWEPDFSGPLNWDEPQITERFTALLDDSVRLQMRSDVPVGTYLSGGLDSSTVTMAAARHAGEPLKTFTGAFREGPEYDESHYAELVARHAGARSYVIYPSQDDFVENLPRLVYHMDEPAAGPGLFPQYMVARLAQQHVKVCLGGQGADEMFAGYARYAVAYLEQAIKAAIQGGSEEGELAIPLEGMAPNLALLRQYVPMLKRFLQSGVFEPMARRYFRLVDRTEGMSELFTADFRASVDSEAAFARFAEIFNRPATPSYFDRMTYFDMMTSLPALLQVEDRVSMAVSLESRVPLLDRRVVDLMATVPPAIKFKGAEVKYLFKRAVTSLLPREILTRRDKMGFPVPLQEWARGKARSFFADTLLSRASRERGLLDTSVVERLIDHDQAYGRALWGALQLELWHQQFIDGAAWAHTREEMHRNAVVVHE
jgi:asparagine synthase (glutamine-hydrolysing)